MWIKKLFLAAAILLVVGIIFRMINPTQAPVQESLIANYNGSTSTISGLTYTGAQPPIPSRLPTATGALETESPQVVIDRFSTNFNLQPFEDLDDYFVGPQHNLTIARDHRIYSLKFSDRRPPENIIDLTQAVAVANTFVRDFFDTNITPSLLPNSTIFYADAEEYDVVSPEEATLVTLMYGYTVADFPIVVGHDSLVTMSVQIDSNYQVAGIDYVPQRISASPSRTFDTLTVYQALENINQGRGSISYSSAETIPYPELATIVSGELNDSSIEYRFDAETNTIVPYYRFFGTVFNAQSESSYVTIITPAIVTDFSR